MAGTITTLMKSQSTATLDQACEVLGSMVAQAGAAGLSELAELLAEIDDFVMAELVRRSKRSEASP